MSLYSKEGREAEVARMERMLASLKNQLSDAQRKADDAGFENKKLVEELNNLKLEHFRLEKKLEETVKNLENETLNRIDIQNQFQTLKEEHKFDNTLMEQKNKGNYN